MNYIPDIPDILQMMAKACPVKCRVSVYIDSEYPGRIRFNWDFKLRVKNSPLYKHCFEVPYIAVYNSTIVDHVQRSIIQIKSKIKTLAEIA